MVTETYLGATQASLAGHGMPPACPRTMEPADREVRAGRTPKGSARGEIMNRQRNHRPVLRGRRGVGVVVAGALVLVLGATGVHAAFGGRTVAAPVTHPSPTASIDPAAGSPGGRPAPHRPTLTVEPTPTVAPTPTDPSALADGVYPTFVRGVEVQGGTVTVDVLQTFFGPDALHAAVEDGLAWKDVRYAPVYIRNENDFLRTLPVALDARIKLIGTCEAPSRAVGLTDLREETTPFNEYYYYEITVMSGTVVDITQRVAIAGC